MRILFISNFLNHHQKPVADYLYSQLGDGYHFVSCTPMPDVFIKNAGYSSFEDISYNILYYKNESNKQLVEKLIKEVDAVIMGGIHDEYLINLRLNTKKLLLFYSERWHKRIRSYFVLPLRWINGYTYRRFSRFNKENCYMLCSSAYVPNDCRWSFAFKEKTYKWGYFPPFEEVDIEKKLKIKKDREQINILYTSRFLSWKHPELAIKAVQYLHKLGYNVHLTVIGGTFGEDKSSKHLYERCKKIALQTPDCINFIGVLKNSEVRDRMLNADVFLFTSDRNEGWGAVLNEAMSSGCACVVSDSLGASHYLIDNGTNGLLFKNKNIKSLISQLRKLLDDSELRLDISKNAYKTIKCEWSPQIAASRLMQFCDCLIKGKNTPYVSGPCSVAKPI